MMSEFMVLCTLHVLSFMQFEKEIKEFNFLTTKPAKQEKIIYNLSPTSWTEVKKDKISTKDAIYYIR